MGVTKMNQVSPESLIKDILFEWISTVADRRTGLRRRHVRYDPNFARCTVYRGLCCSMTHGKWQAYCIIEVFETSWAVSAHMGSTALDMGSQPKST